MSKQTKNCGGKNGPNTKKKDFTIFIHEEEKTRIIEWVKEKPNIETGKYLFACYTLIAYRSDQTRRKIL